jgi:hypothetical protein
MAAARIQLGPQVCTLDDDGWHAPSAALAQQLNASLAEDLEKVSGSDPAPHATLARLAAERFSGRVLEVEEDPPADSETVH